MAKQVPFRKVRIADKLIKKTIIKLDDKEWTLVVDHNMLIDCEELTGLNLLAGDQANILKPSAKLIRAILYLSLRRLGGKYTLEQVGDLITPDNIVLLQEAILAAWANSNVEEEPGAADPSPAAAS